MRIVERLTFTAMVLGAVLCVAAVFMANAAHAEQTWRIPPNVQCLSYRVTDGRMVSPMSDCYEFITVVRLPEPSVATSYVALGAVLYLGLVQREKEKLS